jgi:hypothetical protein
MRQALAALLLVTVGCGGAPSLSGIELPAGALGSPAARSSFGQSVAILGGDVAIGAPAEDGGARDAGRVHVFDRFDGSLVRTLTSPAPGAGGRFGASIATDGTLLLVGEPGSGRAHLLDAASGVLRATLTGPGDFGRTVALGQGYACVGAPSRGEVSVFDVTDGSRQRVFSRPGALGSALALAQGRLIAGAPGAGRAYVFDPADGREIRELSGPGDFGAAVGAADGGWLVGAPSALRVFLYDGAGSLARTFEAPGFADSFGTGVAYDDDHVIVAGMGVGVPSLFLFDPASGTLVRTIQSTSPNEGLSFTAFSGIALVGLFPTGTNPRPGVAQTFSCDSGALLQTFTSPGNTPMGGLGASVAFVNGLIAVGAPGEGSGGLVHLFDDTGALVRTVMSPSPASIGRFGQALAASGTTLAVGAPGELGGRVHLFDATDGSFLRTLQGSGSFVEFGSALTIEGADIYVGSPGDVVVVQQTIPAAGRVHQFALATGIAGFIFQSPSPTGSGRFGTAVAAFGGEILIGAPGEVNGEGRAHVFRTTDGVLLNTLAGSSLNTGGFGAAVAVTANNYWVGAPNEDFQFNQQVTSTGAGAVHAFDLGDDLQDNVLRSASFPQMDAHFGSSLAADGGLVVVGAPTDLISGVAHLYDDATRIRQRKFLSPRDLASGGGFGTGVAIAGTLVAVGAPLEDRGPTAPDAGFAYLFDATATANLYSPQITEFAFFGWDVAVLDADTVIIGAPFEDTGAVHLIDPSGAEPPITLLGQASGDEFGWSVAVAAGNVIVSAPFANLGTGEAYLYDPAGNLLQTFQSPDGSATGFGDEVAGVGANVLVGSPEEVVNDVSNVGRAYLFAPDGTLLQTFESPNPESDGTFGASVSGFGQDLLVGAPGENAGAGRAYLFADDGTLLRTFDGAAAGQAGHFGAGVGFVNAGILAGTAFEVAVGATETTAGGSVTTFNAATGAITGNVENPDGFQGESIGFGEAFAEVNGMLAVGSPIGAFGFGSVYFFGENGALLGSITSPNAQPGGSFGHSLEAFGDEVLVGAPIEDVNPFAAGRAYVMGFSGQTTPGPQPDATFQSPTPVAGGGFGAAVAFAGAVPIVGAPGEGEGVVYLFDPVTLQPDLALQSPTPVTGAMYGAAIAANFLQITVGEPGGAGGAGQAHLYNAGTNLLEFTFDTTNPEAGGLFGASVAVAGINAVVGAPGEDAGAGDSGRAYYFDCLSAVALQIFESPNPVQGGNFGSGVATVNFDVYVGAAGEGAGNVYRFAGLTGLLVDTYPHPDPQTGAAFGAALAMFGTNLLVGAPSQDVATGTADAGTVYLINTANGTVLRTFTKPVPAAGDAFGSSVAAVGNSVFVGAPGAQQGAGEVWEFNGTTGAVIAQYASPNPEGGGVFGAAVAAITGNLLVGAPGEDGGDQDAGIAYLNPPPE